jgi:hypothetical protein
VLSREQQTEAGVDLHQVLQKRVVGVPEGGVVAVHMLDGIEIIFCELIIRTLDHAKEGTSLSHYCIEKKIKVT